jgi:chromosome segregation ATPase
MNPPDQPTPTPTLAPTYASKSARAWLAELDAAVAERDNLRAEVERWKTVATQMTAEREHNANEASRLRAEVERLTAKIGNQADRIRYLEGAINHATGTPLSKAIARAEKAEAALAEAKLERETIAQSSLRSLEAYIDKIKQFAERAERAEAEIAEWSVLNLWGGTPEIVHEFIKGQQNRIHHCQDLEAELITERARLDWLESNPEAVKASSVFKSSFGRKVWWYSGGGNYDTARAAIDASMKNESNTP